MYLLMKAAITRPWVSVPPPGDELATIRIVFPSKEIAGAAGAAASLLVGVAVAAGLRSTGLGVAVGAGYGVSIDAVNSGKQVLSASNYGREKGNTQLAVIEETGFIGISIYSLFLFYTSRLAYKVYSSRCYNQKEFVFLCIIFSSIVGFILHSSIEAWWVAPGAMETAYFWSLNGAFVGFSQKVLNRRSLIKNS